MFGRRLSTDAILVNPNGVPNGALATPALSEGAPVLDSADKSATGNASNQPTGRRERGDLSELDWQIVREAVPRVRPVLAERVSNSTVLVLTRGELAKKIEEIVNEVTANDEPPLLGHQAREVVTKLINERLAGAQESPAEPSKSREGTSRASIDLAKEKIQPILLERIDMTKAIEIPRGELARQVTDIAGEILSEQKMQLNLLEQRDLITTLLNDMLGLGPLEPLLADEAVTDIMVNGAKQVYVERKGKLEITDVTFRDNAHVMNIATRIVAHIGRRIDESTPLVDARLEDGSRVNIIIPPLAIDGATISIRKFSKKDITLDIMARQKNLSEAMAKTLKIASRSQLNILISGGTGSGKTTLLNALSQLIDPGERIVTIEDAAELQLLQPHVVRLETRPPNLEGGGTITQTDLVRNALRMRPDRIILGEIRGAEALDMLQAMNTGHDGSLGTIHANNPREALTRLENMVAMSGVKLPAEAVRGQIAGAVNMIVQISRMRDGVRRITQITEIIGMEGEVITTQDLFNYKFEGEGADGLLKGSFENAGVRPNFADRASYFGLEQALLEAVL